MIKSIEFIRNIHAGDLFENVLVSAIASILSVRFFLHLTGYPQIARGGLHFAHVLWGGVLMLISIIVLLSFLGRKARIIGSILGGIGFGLFIDELGKFITKDNNYFYEPTIAFIYLIFLALFFLFRFIENYSPLSEKEYLMNALLMLEEAVNNDLDEQEKKKYKEFLKNAGNFHYLSNELQSLTTNLVIHKPVLNRFTKFSKIVNSKIDNLLMSARFKLIVLIIFILQILLSLFTVLIQLFFDLPHAPMFLNQITDNISLTSWGEIISVLLSIILAISGVAIFKFSLFRAYWFFKYSLLVSILLTSFFSFYRLQFYALSGLIINIFLLFGINQMINHVKINSISIANKNV